MFPCIRVSCRPSSSVNLPRSFCSAFVLDPRGGHLIRYRMYRTQLYALHLPLVSPCPPSYMHYVSADASDVEQSIRDYLSTLERITRRRHNLIYYNSMTLPSHLLPHLLSNSRTTPRPMQRSGIESNCADGNYEKYPQRKRVQASSRHLQIPRIRENAHSSAGCEPRRVTSDT